MRGPEGNDIRKTNVPNLRIAFRHEASLMSFKINHKMQVVFSLLFPANEIDVSQTWKEEMQYVYSGKGRFPEEIEL
jgi:AMP deaminase